MPPLELPEHILDGVLVIVEFRLRLMALDSFPCTIDENFLIYFQ